MKLTTVGDIQKNFSAVLKELNAGEEVIVTKRGIPVARLASLGPRKDIDWPDYFSDAVTAGGKTVSEQVIEEREDRF